MSDSVENPNSVFELLAYILFRVRVSLEEGGGSGGAPRWIRIARAREFKEDTIGGIVAGSMDGFTTVLSTMAEIVLDLKELLKQTDAMVAILEATMDLLSAAADEKFQAGIMALINDVKKKGGGSPSQETGIPALKTFNDIIKQAKDYTGMIPTPEDLDVLAHQLYLLLCVVQLPLPKDDAERAKAKDETLHLDVVRSGKAHLMTYAFERSFTVLDVGDTGEDASKMNLWRLGARRVWNTGSDKTKLPSLSRYIFEATKDKILEFTYPLDTAKLSEKDKADDAKRPEADRRKEDIAEVRRILTYLGYDKLLKDGKDSSSDKNAFDNNLSGMLLGFQYTNDLAPTAELDNPTLNLLWNLDYDIQNLRHPKTCDVAKTPDPIKKIITDNPTGMSRGLKLVNPAADTPKDEDLEPLPPRGTHNYKWYQWQLASTDAPAPGQNKQRWLADYDRSKFKVGFVALQSRQADVKGQKVTLANGQASERVQGFDTWFDGGAASPGESAEGGKDSFFFCARYVDPWRAGRQGPVAPEADALDQVMPTAGTRSLLYQWLSLEDVKKQMQSNSWDAEVYAKCMVRSLYREEGGPSGTEWKADQALIRLEAYDNFTTGSDANWLKPRVPGNRVEMKETAPYPDETVVRQNFKQADGDATKPQYLAKSMHAWKQVQTERIALTDKMNGLAICLEGIHCHNYDIDAYFDKVEVLVEFKPKAKT